MTSGDPDDDAIIVVVVVVIRGDMISAPGVVAGCADRRESSLSELVATTAGYREGDRLQKKCVIYSTP